MGALEDLSGVSADQAIHSREASSIADQAADRDELAPLIDRRNGMTRCQRHELVAPAEEERVGADERGGMQLDKGCEGGVDLAFGAGLQDIELQPLLARRLLHVLYHALGTRTVRVREQGGYAGLGNQIGQQLESLGR